GRARVGPELLAAVRDRLEPFAAQGLLSREGDAIVLGTGALPYARAIAAVFDAYRSGARQFSSAV
ncbi:hypothetical protein ABTM63_20015, partial [Acinetobacter baumannii]